MEEIIAVLHKITQKIEEESILPIHSIRPALSWYQKQSKTLQENKTMD